MPDRNPTRCHKIFCFRFFSWIIFPLASKNTKICRLFYICGPSACVAICGFAICRPNIFCNLQILRSADPNLLRICNFCKSANSLLFCCIAPMVWAFLLTTVQLPATQKGGRRRKRHSTSTREWGQQLFSPRQLRVLQACAGRAVLIRPPLPPSSPTVPPPPHGWIYVIFSVLGQKRGWPLFRGSKVLQLNSDSFCDYVRIWTEVIGHLWAKLGFWIFPGKRWKYTRPRIFGQDANILAGRAGTTAGTVRQRRHPAYKLGGLGADPTWGLHGGETTSPERELFSQT